ncbi:MAG: hypothetical protein EXR78_07795 [Deltaproteobacteria bacterium]|nr:hypothetical protein [Deltaproteobacteria bacterium]
MPSERYEILLPLKYNDGTAVEPEKFQETRRELVSQFGALTMEVSPLAGLWVSGEREYQDELIRFVVDTEATPETNEFFQTLKERLKDRFRQIEIWVTAYPIRLI